MISAKVFSVSSDKSRQDFGYCDFVLQPRVGEFVELTPNMKPPKRYKIIGIEHRAVTKSEYDTWATRDSTPEFIILVDEGELIRDLL